MIFDESLISTSLSTELGRCPGIMNKSAEPALITTSWDDAHPLDVKLAGYLRRQGIHATFYAPRRSDQANLSPDAIRELSSDFEIGAHTMSHVDLLTVGRGRQAAEIKDSKKWVEDITSKPCTMFCPPFGRYDEVIVDIVRNAGYVGFRTVESMSISFPRLASSVYVFPTSIQLCNHGALGYLKNSAKRSSLTNLINYARYGFGRPLREAAMLLLKAIQTRGGCFHLWGHSWEIEQQGLWGTLDEVLSVIASLALTIPAVSNTEACSYINAIK